MFLIKRCVNCALTSFITLFAIRKLPITIALILFSAASVNAYQSAESSAQTSKSDDVEEIEVLGRAGDAALQAFAMGNYELAEVQFKKNVECALRAERNLRSFADGARNAEITQSLGNNQSIDGRTSMTMAPAPVNPSSMLARNKPLKDVTCKEHGYQVYMVGMSQLQLGRSEEAEKNFESAIRLNKHLHDAMFRLALMKILREDKEGAAEHFEDMQKLLKRCNNLCDAQEPLEANIAFLEQALAGNVRR
jgi:tetratricopeptide (TPR) repeat protein